MSSKRDLTVADNWDAHAEQYAERANQLTEPFARDLVHAIAPLLQKPTTRTVLDVCCGAGAFAAAYLARFPRGIVGQTVVCTDFSPAMVAASRRTVDAYTGGRACDTRFEFAVEDATKLAGVDDNSVQVVVSAFGIFLVPDGDKVFEQVRRVLATDVPHGFGMTAWTPLPPNFADENNFGIEMRSASMLATRITHPETSSVGEVKAGQPSNEKWMQWGDPKWAQSFITDAGLKNSRVSRSLHTQCTGDKDDLWQMMTTASPMIDVTSRSKEEICAMKKEFFQCLNLLGHEGAVFLVSSANIITAEIC